MVVMMEMEISCKGHCEKLSHFLDHMSHTVYNMSMLCQREIHTLQYLFSIWSCTMQSRQIL